jgi:hypothetical protein
VNSPHRHLAARLPHCPRSSQARRRDGLLLMPAGLIRRDCTSIVGILRPACRSSYLPAGLIRRDCTCIVGIRRRVAESIKCEAKSYISCCRAHSNGYERYQPASRDRDDAPCARLSRCISSWAFDPSFVSTSCDHCGTRREAGTTRRVPCSRGSDSMLGTPPYM